jgi:C4-dicarboxylate-binding protein DctP
MTRLRSTITAAALVAAALAGCGSSNADKAGGSDEPVVLRLATLSSERPAMEQPDYFAREVAKLSKGALKVEVIRDPRSNAVADQDSLVASAVESGRADLGWMAARGWDRQGVTSFRALQAPFLITDESLLHAVAESDVPARMLAGLKARGMDGLALVPARLRHLFGIRRPLVSLEDYRGARIRVLPSATSDDVTRALGARPMHLANVDIGAAVRTLDAREGSLDSDPVATWLVGNVTPWAKMITLFASHRALGKLDSGQREILQRAARAAVDRAIDAAVPEAELVQRYCTGGRVTLASAGQLADLRRATRPVYAKLDRDPQTKQFIAAIEKIRAATPTEPDPVVDPECSVPPGATTGPSEDPSTLDGTYRWHLTEAGARRAGTVTNPDDPAGKVNSMTLRDGRWLLGGPDHDHGTFTIRGERLVFDWPATGSVLTFSYVRRKDDTLDITPVLPMDPGDQYVWASTPWHRVGPPVRQIP